MKRKNIFYKPLAMELNRLGFDILDIIPHRSIPNFYVFTFEDTAEFRKAFTRLSKELKEKCAETQKC